MPLDPGEVPLNPHLQGIADAIVAALGGGTNFTAVHVRRGDKAKDHDNWPNLDRDTRPERCVCQARHSGTPLASCTYCTVLLGTGSSMYRAFIVCTAHHCTGLNL